MFVKTWSCCWVKKHGWASRLRGWRYMWGLKIVCDWMMVFMAVSMGQGLINTSILSWCINSYCLLRDILTRRCNLFQKFRWDWPAIIQFRFGNWYFLSLWISCGTWHRYITSIYVLKIMFARWANSCTLMVMLCAAVICIVMIMSLFLCSTHACCAQKSRIRLHLMIWVVEDVFAIGVGAMHWTIVLLRRSYFLKYKIATLFTTWR